MASSAALVLLALLCGVWPSCSMTISSDSSFQIGALDPNAKALPNNDAKNRRGFVYVGGSPWGHYVVDTETTNEARATAFTRGMKTWAQRWYRHVRNGYRIYQDLIEAVGIPAEDMVLYATNGELFAQGFEERKGVLKWEDSFKGITPTKTGDAATPQAFMDDVIKKLDRDDIDALLLVSGHGAPHGVSALKYLGSDKPAAYFRWDEFVTKLTASAAKYKSITVVINACYSGQQITGDTFANAYTGSVAKDLEDGENIAFDKLSKKLRDARITVITSAGPPVGGGDQAVDRRNTEKTAAMKLQQTQAVKDNKGKASEYPDIYVKEWLKLQVALRLMAEHQDQVAAWNKLSIDKSVLAACNKDLGPWVKPGPNTNALDALAKAFAADSSLNRKKNSESAVLRDMITWDQQTIFFISKALHVPIFASDTELIRRIAQCPLEKGDNGQIISSAHPTSTSSYAASTQITVRIKPKWLNKQFAEWLKAQRPAASGKAPKVQLGYFSLFAHSDITEGLALLLETPKNKKGLLFHNKLGFKDWSLFALVKYLRFITGSGVVHGDRRLVMIGSNKPTVMPRDQMWTSPFEKLLRDDSPLVTGKLDKKKITLQLEPYSDTRDAMDRFSAWVDQTADAMKKDKQAQKDSLVLKPTGAEDQAAATPSTNPQNPKTSPDPKLKHKRKRKKGTEAPEAPKTSQGAGKSKGQVSTSKTTKATKATKTQAVAIETKD